MLNRRSLRIKVMQSLFALHQNKEASYLVSRDQVEKAFEPDLNSMVVQDKKELKARQKEAVKLFLAVMESGEEPVHGDPFTQQVIQDGIVLFENSSKKDFSYFQKSLVKDVEKIYTHYISVLTLGIAIAEAAAADKKINHSNFLSNRWIQALVQSEELKQEAARLQVSWNIHADHIRSWFRNVVKEDAEYMAYLDKKAPSVEDQKKIVNHFFRRIILKKTVIADFFEEEVLHWAEDQEIVKGMVEKTIKSFAPEKGGNLQLHSLSLNWDDDLEFIQQLFKGAAHISKEHQQLIAENTRNWEVERLPLTDRVILEMAITEMITFPSIPVKVTINEYIELAKNYSTPKSRQFINGILDVISKALKAKGSLKKSGRGLMDNK